MYVKVVIGGVAAERGRKSSNESSETSIQQPLEVLVNLDCPIRIIYDYIRESLGINSNLEFDLCDEFGRLKYLYEYEPWLNGTLYLEPRATYFVVLFEKDEENRLINPMLRIPDSIKKSSAQWEDILHKIRKQINPSTMTKPSRTSRVRSSTTSFGKY